MAFVEALTWLTSLVEAAVLGHMSPLNHPMTTFNPKLPAMQRMRDVCF